MNSDKLWSITELIEYYPAFSLWGVRWLLRNRSIPIVKIGRRIYFDPKDIEDWINENKIKPIK